MKVPNLYFVLSFMLWLQIDAYAQTPPDKPQTTSVTPSSIRQQSGDVEGGVNINGQERVIMKATGGTIYYFYPEFTVLYDRIETEANAGKLCVEVLLDSEKYRNLRSAFNSSLTYSRLELSKVTMALVPKDVGEKAYTWVSPRSSEFVNLQNSIKTCFDIGRGKKAEEIAKRSSLRVYADLPTVQGTQNQCTLTASLNKSFVGTGKVTSKASEDLLITGEQLNSAISKNKLNFSHDCVGTDKDILKNISGNNAVFIPKILERFTTEEASFEELKKSLWNYGFSMEGSKVIEIIAQHKNTTVSTQNLKLNASDFAGLGISADNGKTITQEDLNNSKSTVTIPPSLKVYRFAKSSLSSSAVISSRELLVTGNGSSTIVLHSNFVEDGVLRTVNQIKMDHFPPNAVVAWYGKTDLPDGWAACDGKEYPTSGGGIVKVPDLTDRFLYGKVSTAGAEINGSESKNIELNIKATEHSVQPNGSVLPGQSVCLETSNNGNCRRSTVAYKAIHFIEGKVNVLPPYASVQWICRLP